MDTEYLKKTALYILSVICALALIFYIVYHALDGFTTDITTVTAELTTHRNTVAGDGYIFRDEEYITSSYGGTVNYLVKSGEKVSLEQQIAEVFSDESGYATRAELSSIEKRLDIIKESLINFTAASADTSHIDNQILTNYKLILTKIAEGKFSHAMRTSENLLAEMSKRQIITDGDANFKELERTLSNRMDTLTSLLRGHSEVVISPEAGYFFSDTDGYENIFTKKNLDSLTVSSFYSLTEKEPEDVTGSRKPIGKLAKSYIWYIAVPMPKADAFRFEAREKYDTVFSYNYDTELPLTVEKIITEVGDDRAVVVFSCEEMPNSFSYARQQSVRIITNEKSGLRVPKTAVRILDGTKGVYTLYGSTVKFKRVNILLDTDGCYIVSVADPTPDAYVPRKKERKDGQLTEDPFVPSSAPYIKLYDQIIVSGKDLEDGMVFY